MLAHWYECVCWYRFLLGFSLHSRLHISCTSPSSLSHYSRFRIWPHDISAHALTLFMFTRLFCTQNKLQKSQVSLYVNGQLRQEGKLKMGRITSVLNLIAAPPTAHLTIFLGLPNNVQPQDQSDMQWKMRGDCVTLYSRGPARECVSK